MNCGAKTALNLDTDEFWRGGTSSPSGGLPLMEMAVGHEMTSSDLTYIHHQLLCTMELIVVYQVKGFKPVALFPERVILNNETLKKIVYFKHKFCSFITILTYCKLL